VKNLLKAITFDFWDTLYKAPRDERLANRRAGLMSQALAQIGIKAEETSIKEAFIDSWQFAHKYQVENGLDITPRGQFDFILDHMQITLGRPDWLRIYQLYTSVLPEFPPQLNDGVREALPRLSSHFKLAIICNTGISPGTVLRKLLKADDILRFFEFQLFSDEVRWAKPNEKIFNYALQLLQVRNDEAAHVGDDSSTDVTGAKRAGMTAVWLAPGIDKRLAEADFQIKSIIELPTIFGMAD